MRECLLAGLACNDSRLLPGGEASGDPTEAALLVSAARAGLTESPPRLDTLPFSSERRYMATLHPGVGYVKGSVERVLDLCATQIGGEALDRPAAMESAERLGHDGLRVLAFARAEVPPEAFTLAEEDLPPLVFLGLQGMYDPPRAASVQACLGAGTQVKMITGDHATTAQAIAKRTGLDGPVMTGTDLEDCTDELLPDAAERTTVFARVSPEQKLRLVRALQSRGHVVAMTGDGGGRT